MNDVVTEPPVTQTDANPGPLQVVPLTAENEAAWDAFVASHPESSHYHRAGWSRVFERAMGRRCLYRMAVAGDRVEGVLPHVSFSHPLFGKFLISVPFMNRGGLLTTSDRARQALVADAWELLEQTGAEFCELRHVERMDESLPVRETKVSMSLDVTPGREALWKSVGAKVRNLVRKAEKSELSAREGNLEQELDAFYDIFAENMRDLGTPVYTPKFFREVAREFPESLRLNVVEGDAVGMAAAGITVTHRDFTEIHWAASRRELLKQSPNMALYWEAISHAADSGLREFCFGRSTEGSGPWRFKKQWGAEPTRLRWEYLLPAGKEMPGLNPDNPKYKLAVEAWKKLPLGVSRVLGPPIVRHLP